MTHHDDELLSMVLDGEAVADGDRAHVESCDECGIRLAELRRAAALVATPVHPVPAEARRRAIAAAMDATGPVVLRPLRGRSRFANWGGPLLAAAAVVVAIVVAVPLLAGQGGDDSGDVAITDATAGPVRAGDLGELGDGSGLADRVRDALPGGSGAGGSSLRADEAEGGGDEDEAAAEGATDHTADSDTMTMATGEDAATLAQRCEPAARRDADLGALRYVATARWDGTPAVVLAFGPPDSGGDDRIWVYVLASDDCRILNWQRA